MKVFTPFVVDFPQCLIRKHWAWMHTGVFTCSIPIYMCNGVCILYNNIREMLTVVHSADNECYAKVMTTNICSVLMAIIMLYMHQYMSSLNLYVQDIK